MTKEALGFMNNALETLEIPYQFMKWTSPQIPFTYFTGEYQEVESINEDGMEESVFMLNGITKGKFLVLEDYKQKIKAWLGDGLTVMLENGSGLAVMYSDSFPVPSVEMDVHRLQINLKIKEWKGQ